MIYQFVVKLNGHNKSVPLGGSENDRVPVWVLLYCLGGLI